MTDETSRRKDVDALHAMDLPLNPAVEHRGFSSQTEEKIDAVLTATRLFGESANAWGKNKDDYTYAAATRRLSELKTAREAVSFPAHLTEHSEEAREEAREVREFTRCCDLVCQEWDNIWSLSDYTVIERYPWPLGKWPAVAIR